MSEFEFIFLETYEAAMAAEKNVKSEEEVNEANEDSCSLRRIAGRDY